ncbi:MAG: hypothetical protein WA793_11205 [Sphingorhabdus sp.]|uniref:hypothetical protein n=1 Tax=Sphingorhabdus sp. TaxID=1902408 RepID=UPI003CA9D8D6
MFESAKLKVQWANSHADKLNRVFAAFLESDFYTFSNERDAESGYYRIDVSSKNAMPMTVPLLLGDIVHNLRTALDHAATSIVGNGQDVYFPFHRNLINFITAEGQIVCSKTKLIEEAMPELGRFIIDEIKPYEAGNALLWRLTKLDAIDKHKFLLPTVELTSVTAYDLYDSENENSIGRLNATVGSGDRVNIVSSFGKFEVRGKIEPSFEILFGKDTFFENQPVIETLFNISNAVSETLCRVEEFVTSAKETSG